MKCLKSVCFNFQVFLWFIAGSEKPPLTVLRKFAYLLDQSDLDFQEELEVTRLREEVVTNIRSSQQLEKDLNLMDIKIGLLVKNRISLQVGKLVTNFTVCFQGIHFWLMFSWKMKTCPCDPSGTFAHVLACIP